ncbi:response regulator [Roseateles sp. DAIF2]|uniref:response regulator n=1 Tax=Roseateles sp. DAIF2 TaxID=2714952 RepID=UPI0018A2E562|nr:response regulator [Roseateles sp. DAIF2]QPF71840.1 response regulator [Roseateles sp. DAIF2]
MPFEVPELLSHYLLPLLIAVPLAIVVIVISRRRGDDDEVATRAPRPPAAPPAAAAAPVPATPPPPTFQPTQPVKSNDPAHLLLVDDSAVVRAKLGKLFEGAGYRITLAKDGVEALEALAAGQHFAVLVTDLEMPNKDGFELIAAVQGDMATENLPIIAITGHDELHTRVHEIQGLYGLFKKPWNDRELLKRVETLAAMRH